MEKQVGDIAVEDEDLYRAYRARAFDEQEYAARREALKDRRKKLEQEKTELANRVLSPEMSELNKERILRQSEVLREQGLAPNPPFEVKQTILKLVVERIKLNVAENWFEIEGVIPGFYELDVSTESIPMDTGSSRQAA